MNKQTIRTCIPVAYQGTVAYEIYLEKSFDRLPDCMQKLDTGNRKICLVTDSTVRELYGEQVRKLIASCCQEVTVFTFPAGEPSKTLDTVRSLYEHLIVNHMERKDLLVALGGGVVGDLAGYAAATYLRGIDFIQIPTTLLSQVDSSIGGKTGVDFAAYKNMVGAFHQPKLVYMNISTLSTLSEEQFSCGMGEILKHGLIRDAAYYEWTITNMTEIRERNADALLEMISRSCEIKRSVVEKDPCEKGERALLNFGHTLGHAIEKQKNFQLLHGQCVALGYLAAAYISWKRGLLTAEEFFEIRDMNVGFGLPITLSDLDADSILETTKSDKKMDHGHVKFILLKGIGNAMIDRSVTEEEMRAALGCLNPENEESYE